MPLVIVESPNKCAKIKKILGNDYVVLASCGHIKDLDKKNMGIDLESWEANYVINPDKKDVVKKIQEEAKNHDEIYIATDGDLEGCCIAFHVKSILPKGKKTYRSIFSTITKNDILKAIKNPIPFDENMYAAQQARRITDRIIGFKVSPIMWAKGMKNTSAGRVQSATLRWLVEREREIRGFKQEEYWSIHADMIDGFVADFYAINGKKVDIANKKEADDILAKVGKTLTVTEYEAKERSRSPSPPFITATLQQEAGTKFNWTASRVMDNAQKLFEFGQITYHRTDSIRIEPSKVNDVRDMIESKYGKNYLSKAAIHYKNEDAAQDAHEAIRPTFESTPDTLSIDERRLLELITNKFMASQMADALFDQTKIELSSSNDNKEYQFKASGSILKFDGFLKVYASTNQDVILPKLKKKDVLKIKKLQSAQHFTKPPARYNDASFVNRMKKDGVGRPSTYAATIDTLLSHDYASREGKNLKPTEIGIMVSDYLSVFFKDITDSGFTAKLEDELDSIAAGKSKKNNVLESFKKILDSELDLAKKGDPISILKTDIDCPSCNDSSKMLKKVNNSKEVFLGCQNYPKCGHVMNFDEDGKVVNNKVETGLPCPRCNNKIAKKKGKFGEFYACTSSSACNWTGSIGPNGEIIEKKKSEVTDISCPSCATGKMVKRKRASDNKEFLGCNGYPKCKTVLNIDENGKVVAAKAKPQKAAKSTGEKCPKCNVGELIEREGRFGKFLGCSNFKGGCKNIKKI